MGKLKTMAMKFAHDGAGLFISEPDIAKISNKIEILQQQNVSSDMLSFLKEIQDLISYSHEDLLILHGIQLCIDKRTMRRLQIDRATKRGGLSMYQSSKENLFDRLWTEAKKANKTEADEILEYCVNPFMAKHELAQEEFSSILTECLHDVIEEAWAQVDFGTENITIKKSDTGNPLLGYQDIDGYTFVGAEACEDGEAPVFFILYWDGKSIKPFVPQNGNCFDPDTKSAYMCDSDEFIQWAQNEENSGTNRQLKIIDEIKNKFVIKQNI